MRKCFLVLVTVLLLFSCTTAMAAGQAQLLYNNDFSIDSEQQSLPAGWYYDAWIPEGADAYTDIDENGEKTVVLDSYEANDARVCQKVEVSPDTCYRLICDIKAQNIQGDAGASLSVLDTFSSSAQYFNTDNWQTVELIGVTGPEQTELVLALRIGGYGALASGQAWFRNVSMTVEENAPEAALSFEALKYEGTAGDTDETAEAPDWAAIVLTAVLSVLAFFILYQKGIRRAVGGGIEAGEKQYVTLVLGGALLLRIVLSLLFVGHSTDIGCFMGWADAMAEYGPAGFYTSGIFADYPPGYMYVLWALGGLRRLLGLDYGSPFFVLLIKLPALMVDLFSAYIVYRFAKRSGLKGKSALLLLGIVALHPAFAFISGGWGQIDSLLTLCLLGTIWLFTTDRRIAAGAVFGLAILIKPQALMAGPLFAVAYLCELFKHDWKKRLLETVLAVLAALAVILLPSLPFGSGQEQGWLLEKYFSTATSYPYASIEAFNLPALIGGNWENINRVPFLFSYAAWGYISIALSVGAAAGLYVIAHRKKQAGALYLVCAFLIAALFTLGPYMHERYLFPAMLLLLIACMLYNDRRLYIAFFWFSATLLLNVLCAFIIVDYPSSRAGAYETLTFLGSLLTVLGFGYFCYACADIILRGQTHPTAMKLLEKPAAAVLHANPLPQIEEPPAAFERKLRFTRRDRMYCWGLTLLYACIALLNLGTLSAPESEYYSGTPGETVKLHLDKPVEVSEFWIYGGIAEGTLLLEAEDGSQITYEQTYDEMFRWDRVEVNLTSQDFSLMTYSGELRIREMAFFDTQGNRVNVQALGEIAVPIVDEPDTVPEVPSYLNGMYFDELYHARTAYEHLKGMDPYENSHPPLGKVFIMLGVALLGMNTFGWRVVGTFFGVGMVPIFYMFGKRLFKKPEYALLGAVLFAFDFMHFTQTRIATIDVYAVFFILLMYYYMYQYYSMSFYTDGLKATIKPLGLAGLFFALGAATKWICIYAGLGLAVLLFLSLLRRYREYKRAMASGDIAQKKLVRGFNRNLISTLLWCCVFFILIPAGIYLLAYMPYYLCEMHYGLRDVWNYQKFMWSYHSGLTATHPYQSTWWEWPFTFRPMWYYLSDNSPAGYISTLTASGNPAVWWVCTLGALGLAAQRITDNMKSEPGITVVFVGVCANFLPWVLVSRCTFIYHFFATVPFIILCTVYLLHSLEQKSPRLKWVKWVWMAVCVLLFLLLYPGLSGLEIPIGYAKLLKLLPGGNLLYGV